MPQVDALKLKDRLSACRMAMFTLAALVETSEQELHDLIAGTLEDDERAQALRRDVETALRLGEDALAPEATIPDAAARKAAARKLRAARKALGGAIDACRTGGGAGFCETMEHQLLSLDQLDAELEGKAATTEETDEEG